MANTTTTKTIKWTHGVNVIHAGMPVDTDGNLVMDNTAVGIIAEDVYAPDTTATVITAGEWDESVNAPYFHISDTVKKTLTDITFTPLPEYTASDMMDILQNVILPTFVSFEDTATTEAAGIVKQAAAVADASSAPTKTEYNGLLGALRTAGIIATGTQSESH